ncbi:uncharacterized protein DNG_09323 [Cephalotrichum gorgonifer]|uniref:AMP-activated protein kinase glycogen-binding domain-containing protein n=1 Tax=Cephalotrichum gorgonifer TaxID=2041049 RepID=A0AAE8SZ69_9PEZI|nr:uncharacterized protein DNG_09323 [Cephalotrichum gorgonifer]
MGQYKFKWNHPAQKVVVTGTFDNWSQSETLDKIGDGFEKTVKIQDPAKTIYYKFVVDGVWTTDHTAPQERDSEGNQNNVLTPDHIMADDQATLATAGATAAILNNVAPDSTTAQLAGAVAPTTSSKKNKKKKKKGKGGDKAVETEEPAEAAAAVPEEKAAEEAVAAPEEKAVEAAPAVEEAATKEVAAEEPVAAPAAAAVTEAEKPVEVPAVAAPAVEEAAAPVEAEKAIETPAAVEESAAPVEAEKAIETPTAVEEAAAPVEAEKAVEAPAVEEAAVKEVPAEETAAAPAVAAVSEAEKPVETPAAAAPALEEKGAIATPTDVPGGFPATPAADADADKEIGVNPLPAANGAINPIKLAAGEEVPKVTTEDNKNVKLDKESYEKSDALPGVEDLETKPVSVNPLPAADFGVNPVKLEPGAEVPAVTAEDINKNVKLDKESYEKSDALPGLESLPPVAGNTIPESSLPVMSAAEAAILNSAAPESTTAALAGQVPLEPKAPEVPAVVKESQEKAAAAPEASAVAEEVKEKAAVEEELKQKVAEAPAVAESNPKAPEVPAVVKESQEKAAAAPEASAVAEEVKEKAAVEEELKQKVTEAPAVAESKPEVESAEPVVADAAAPAPVEEVPAKAAEAAPAQAVEETPAQAAEETPAKTTEAAAPAESSKPAEAVTTNGTKTDAGVAKKKKGRLSLFISKLKSKFSDN